MNLWQLLGVVGIFFVILEMFTPSLFFLNFALAAFITSGVSVFVKNPYTLAIIFVVLSFLSFAFLRPVLKKSLAKNKETGVNCKYVGQVAKVEEEVTETCGVISIYGERWEARSENGNIIPQGSEVKIVRNESIIMYVVSCS